MLSKLKTFLTFIYILKLKQKSQKVSHNNLLSYFLEMLSFIFNIFFIYSFYHSKMKFFELYNQDKINFRHLLKNQLHFFLSLLLKIYFYFSKEYLTNCWIEWKKRRKIIFNPWRTFMDEIKVVTPKLCINGITFIHFLLVNHYVVAWWCYLFNFVK